MIDNKPLNQMQKKITLFTDDIIHRLFPLFIVSDKEARLLLENILVRFLHIH